MKEKRWNKYLTPFIYTSWVTLFKFPLKHFLSLFDLLNTSLLSQFKVRNVSHTFFPIHSKTSSIPLNDYNIPTSSSCSNCDLVSSHSSVFCLTETWIQIKLHHHLQFVLSLSCQTLDNPLSTTNFLLSPSPLFPSMVMIA